MKPASETSRLDETWAHLGRKTEGEGEENIGDVKYGSAELSLRSELRSSIHGITHSKMLYSLLLK